MNNLEVLPLAFIGGLVLGLLYFRFLWLTVRHLAVSPRPIRLMVISFAARLGVILSAFYFIMDGHGERLFIALSGFIAAREICKRLWGQSRGLRHIPATDKGY
jgi:F1F0 ATPase subunit 2